MKKYFSLLIAVLMISAIICGCCRTQTNPATAVMMNLLFSACYTM